MNLMRIVVQKNEPVNGYECRKMTIHERLRIERERLGLSQAAVYSRLPVTKGTYIKYESGETSPSARHLAVLDLMGFDIYYIVVGERSANELGTEFSNLISAYSKCSEELRGAALAVLMSHRLRQVGAAKCVPHYFDDDAPSSYGADLPPSRAMHEPGARAWKEGLSIPGELAEPVSEGEKKPRTGGAK